METGCDQSDENKLKAADLLAMPGTDVAPSLGGIEVKFKHVMSKIHLTIELGDEYEFTEGIDQKIKNVKVDGSKVNGSWEFTDGASPFRFTLEGDAAPITPLLTGTSPYSKAADGTITKAKATYEVILVPQTIAADGFSISFEVDGKTYKWTYGSELTLATGTAYTLKLTAGDDKVQPATFEAAPWSAGNGEEGESKETD